MSYKEGCRARDREGFNRILFERSCSKKLKKKVRMEGLSPSGRYRRPALVGFGLAAPLAMDDLVLIEHLAEVFFEFLAVVSN